MTAAVLAVRTRERDRHHRIVVVMMVVMAVAVVMMVMVTMVVMMIVLRHLDRLAGGPFVGLEEARGVRNRVQQFGERARGLQPVRVADAVDGR